MEYLFGVDIGGTTVKLGCVKTNGEIISKFEIKTDTTNNGVNILKDVASAITSYIKENSIDTKDVKGIGFGVPGPVSNNVVMGCVNLGWGKINVEEEFSKLIDFKTNIGCANDANVAAIGEMWCGNEHNLHTIVMLTLGTGVGGGIVLNGKCVDGVNGAGGEFGHIKTDFKYNFKCNCGLEGCLETVSSATGVVRIAKHLLPNYPNSKLNTVKDITCKVVFDLAKENDELCLKVIDEVGYYIGYISSVIAASVDPQAFIIGGGVSKAGKMLIDSIEKHYNTFAFKAVKDTKFYLATLGNDGGMLGAAYLVK